MVVSVCSGLGVLQHLGLKVWALGSEGRVSELSKGLGRRLLQCLGLKALPRSPILGTVLSSLACVLIMTLMNKIRHYISKGRVFLESIDPSVSLSC